MKKYKQISFAPFLKYYNNSEEQSNTCFSDVQLYGIKLLTYNPNNSTETSIGTMHGHTVWEIHVLCSGRQIYHVENETVELCAGEAFIIFPGVHHCQLFGDEKIFKFSLVLDLSKDEIFSDLAKDKTACGYYKWKANADMVKTLEYLFETVDVSQREDLLAMRHCVELFLFRFRRDFIKHFVGEHLSSTVEKPIICNHSYADLCEQVVQYIRANLKQNLTVPQIAEHFSISSRHLCRKFRSYYYKSPGEVIRDLRCNYAKELLEYTEMSVEEISGCIGFANTSHFIRFFKLREGKTPAAYRREFNELDYRKL